MISIQTYTGGMAATNGYLLQNEREEAVLIDAPEGVSEWLSQAGVSVQALLLTHQHFDHVLDAARVETEHDCAIYAFAPPSTDLTLEAFVADMGISVKPFAVDTILEGQSEVQIPEIEWKFQLLHVPGHSPDSLCYGIAQELLLFSGDTLFHRSIGRTDFPHSDGPLLIHGIQHRLFTLPEDTKVYPGHMEATTIGEEKVGNPFAHL